MVNLNISNIGNSLITVVKPAGKSFQLLPGEILQAEVVDIMPGGGVTLRIKGSFLTVKADLLLQKGMTALLKAPDNFSAGGALKLQFMGYSGVEGGNPEIKNLQTSPAGDNITKLLKELAGTLPQDANRTAPQSMRLAASLKSLGIIESLLKALPDNIDTLPKGIRLQLQNLLQAGLKATGQGIQARLEEFANSGIPDILKDHPLVQNLKRDLLVSMDKLMYIPLKSALQDTGVAFEAKLRAIADLLMKVKTEDLAGTEKPIQLSALKTSNNSEAELLINKDLKAGLLKLKQLIMEERKEITTGLSDLKAGSDQKESSLKLIDHLLKDIETFQLLSKTTDSFYTFLPLNWKELKNGDILFKKTHKETSASSYSCKINLNLEKFGELTILLSMYKDDFFVSFKATDSAFKSVLNTRSEDLKGIFKEKGLNLKTVNIQEAEVSELEPSNTFETTDKILSIKA